MLVVEITKSYRNALVKHLLVLPKDEQEDEETIKAYVENWCESDPGGQIYGYSFSWVVVKDIKIIAKAIEEEIEKADGNINFYTTKKIQLEEYAKTLVIKQLTDDIEKWIVALRSGEYKKTKNDLNNSKGYCCLGVACDLFIPKDKQVFKPGNKYLFGDNPSNQPCSPQWLKDINDDFYKKTDIYLCALNDTGYWFYKPFTFDEIADMLEMVYILKVLED